MQPSSTGMRYRDASNRTEFIYHGNDGTTFAWNDTAQLDYSQHAVREHVIQVIVEVARRFPIIRFDAAMVLAKRHVQRLWFPLPGVGRINPVPCRKRHDAGRLRPHHAARVLARSRRPRPGRKFPGTLLLAEAFWLLESYFVRTLGMHRVYNSAFMVMLRDEENAKYRSYLKKTIEFDPDIMKRYVNFMSNPDEKTAIDQFGTGDKFFGVATMMATIPGLPMFAHGQVEGYTEKYGMEYKTGQVWTNGRTSELVRTSPGRDRSAAVKNRALFAESDTLRLLRLLDRARHGVDENVFAYSNRLGDQRALILYNNAYSSTRGTVHVSAASMNKWTGELWQRSLADALALPQGAEFFLAYRDTATGLEYLKRANSVVQQGLTLDLRGYQYVVLLHWRDLRSTAEQPWDQLCNALNGAGVHNLDEALTQLRLRPLTNAIRGAVTWDAVRLLSPGGEQSLSEADATRAWAQRTAPVFERWAELESAGPASTGAGYTSVATTLADRAINAVSAAKTAKALPPHTHPEALWSPLLTVAALRALPHAEGNVVDRLGLRASLAEIFSEIGLHGEDAWRTAARVRLALNTTKVDSASFWADPDVYWLAGVNEHEGVGYVNREALEQLLQWLALTAQVQPAGAPVTSVPVAAVSDAAGAAGYRFDAMVGALTQEPIAAPAAQTEAAAAPAKKSAAKKTAAVKAAPVAAKAAPAKAAAKKSAAKKIVAKPAVKKAAAKKVAASPVTVQPASILEEPPVEGHAVVDTAAIPDVTATGKNAAAKKSAAKRSAKPKL